jgi:hypothetical protein
MNARIDRIENGNAVIIFSNDRPEDVDETQGIGSPAHDVLEMVSVGGEAVTNDQLRTSDVQGLQVVMPVKLLPQGAREGSFLTISVELDPRGEQGQREKIGSLLDKLRSKNP